MITGTKLKSFLKGKEMRKSKDLQEALEEKLQEILEEILDKAILAALKDKRKTVMAKDLD